MENYELEGNNSYILNGTFKYKDYTKAFENEEVVLTDDEYKAIDAYGIHLSLNSDEEAFDEDINITDAINAFFAMHKNDYAWELIGKFVEDINFAEITTSQFFVIDREQPEVFKALYKNSTIDDLTYEYFMAINGHIFDTEYFLNKYGDLNFVQIVDAVRAWYVQINPFEVGLIEADDFVKENVLNKLDSDIDVTEYLIGQKAVFELNSELLLKFVENKNIVGNGIAVAYEVAKKRAEYIEDEADISAEIYKHLDFKSFESINIEKLEDFKNYLELVNHIAGNPDTSYFNRDENGDFCYEIGESFLKVFFMNCRSILTDYRYQVCNMVNNSNMSRSFDTLEEKDIAAILPPERFLDIYAIRDLNLYGLYNEWDSFIVSPRYNSIAPLIYNRVTKTAALFLFTDTGIKHQIFSEEDLRTKKPAFFDHWREGIDLEDPNTDIFLPLMEACDGDFDKYRSICNSLDLTYAEIFNDLRN